MNQIIQFNQMMLLRNNVTVKMTFIYALLDPSTREIRYIGKSDNPDRRIYEHIVNRNSLNTHKANWINSVFNKGFRPLIEIIDEVSETEWQAAEAAYIAFFKEEGCNLVNATSGGEGVGSGKDSPNFGRKHSSDELEKMRLANIGKKMSPESCAKNRAARLGRKLSAAHCAKLSASFKGKIKSSDHRARIGASNKGKKRSLVACANNSMAQKGKKLSIEHCAKISAANKGRIPSVETRARMSATQKGSNGYWFGKKFSPAVRANMSAAQKGRKHSPETIAKRSAKLKGKKRSDEQRAKMKIAWVKRRSAGPLEPWTKKSSQAAEPPECGGVG